MIERINVSKMLRTIKAAVDGHREVVVLPGFRDCTGGHSDLLDPVLAAAIEQAMREEDALNDQAKDRQAASNS